MNSGTVCSLFIKGSSALFFICFNMCASMFSIFYENIWLQLIKQCHFDLLSRKYFSIKGIFISVARLEFNIGQKIHSYNAYFEFFTISWMHMKLLSARIRNYTTSLKIHYTTKLMKQKTFGPTRLHLLSNAFCMIAISVKDQSYEFDLNLRRCRT